MKHVIRKAYWNFEKEEKWLNGLSAKGLALTDYTWCRYVFQDAPKGEYIFRIELLENPVKHPESQNYIRFMEETGAEFVASYMRWVYFRKKAADGEFDIYSDTDSRIKHYKRVRTFFMVITVLNLMAAALNFFLSMAVKNISTVNLYCAIISTIVFALLLGLLVVPLSRKIVSLGKERKIRE
jgi:antibiotic biosynthesis monooxygenase (ABM) superfamily enzyme